MRRSYRAFTLVEIMLAIVIFTFCIVSMMTVFVEGMRYNTRAKIMTQAAFLCQAKMEEVLSIPGIVIPEEFNKTGNFEAPLQEFSFVVRKFPYRYVEGAKTYDSVALSQIHITVFHPVNDRKSPLVELYAVKGGVGEQE
ncbi:MAG: type II secretion system GspH family protein [Candidatus Eremiobacteraeota bacterium]|nr:type II secretion system GspH family protein [Candidatus Eremiobacteraeota bacterium]